MKKFETSPNRQTCFIDVDEIAAIVPYKIKCAGDFFQGSKILLKSCDKIKVYGTPELVERQL